MATEEDQYRVERTIYQKGGGVKDRVTFETALEYVKESYNQHARDWAWFHHGRLSIIPGANRDAVEDVLEDDDTFLGKMRVDGWFINKDADLREQLGPCSNGKRNVAVSGVIREYSDKAWKIEFVDNPSASVYEPREHCYVPKALTTVTRAHGETTVDELDDQTATAREWERERRDASWDTRLEDVDPDGADEDDREDDRDTYERAADAERQAGESAYQSAKGDALGTRE